MHHLIVCPATVQIQMYLQVPPLPYPSTHTWNKSIKSSSLIVISSIHPTSWSVSDVQPVAEILHTPFLPTAANEGYGDYTVSALYSGYNPGQDITQWDSPTTIDSMRTLWPTSSDGQHLFPLVDQESGTLHQFLDPLDASLAAYSHYAHSGPSTSIPHHSPPYQSFIPTSPDFGPHPMPSRLLETSHRPHLIFYPSPNRNPASSSRRRHAALAIEHHSLWFDEDELRKALSESDGKLIVHQCRWDEGHSSCGLWITGDKSSINMHIQKWHGGTRGGDKSQADCRWFGCGQTMLKESIPRHIVTIHLDEVWECQGCGKKFVRNDAYGRHAAKSESPACQTSGALISYSANAREIDARAALESGERVWYASA